MGCMDANELQEYLDLIRKLKGIIERLEELCEQ